MSEIILTADISDKGIRLDKFISDNSELSRSLVQNIIETGSVTVNGKAVAKAVSLKMAIEFVSASLNPNRLRLNHRIFRSIFAMKMMIYLLSISQREWLFTQPQAIMIQHL